MAERATSTGRRPAARPEPRQPGPETGRPAAKRPPATRRGPEDRRRTDRRPPKAKRQPEKEPLRSRAGLRVKAAAATAGAWAAKPDGPRRYRVVIVVSALVLLPVLVAVFQHAAGGWVPDGDDAWVARRTMQVFSTSPPLLGQESTASDEPTESGLNHPGPVSYYIMAVPYAATGWSPIGLIVGAGAIVGTSMVLGVAMGWCAFRARGAVGVGVALALLSVRIGQEWLVRPTSSALVVVPLAATMLGLWAYLRGSRAGFFVAFGLGMFTMQTSLVVLPISASLVLATLVIAVSRWVKKRELPASGWSWAFIGAALLLWVPPLIDQFTRSPGNLADLIHYLYSDASGTTRTGKVTEALGFGPSVATVLDGIANPFGLGGRQIHGAAVWIVTPGTLGLGPSIVLFLLVGFAVWWAVSQRRRALRVLLSLAAAATALSVFAFARRPTETLFNSTYFVLWIQAVAVLWWSAIAIAALDAVLMKTRDRRGRPPVGSAAFAREARRQSIVQWSAIGLVGVLAVYASAGSVPEQEAVRVRNLSSQVRSNLPHGTYEVEGKGFVAWLSTGKGLGADLIAHGYDIRFTEWGGMVDEQRRRAHPGMAQIFVVAQEKGSMSEVPDDPTVLGTYRDDEVQLIAIYVPGGAVANLCEQVTSARASVNGLTVGADTLSSPAQLAQILEAINIDQIKKDDDPAVRAAATDLAPQRSELVQQLQRAPSSGQLDLNAIDQHVVNDIKVLFGAYVQHCLVAPPETRAG